MTVIQLIQSVDVYFFSLFLLVLISIKTLNNPNGKTPQARSFSVLLILNFMIIAADCVTVLFDGWSGLPMRVLLMAASAAGFSLQVLICLFWFWYVSVVVFPDRKLIGSSAVLHSLPAIVCVLAAAASCLTGWFFSYDAANVYHRGPLFSAIPLVSLLYLVWGYYLIIRFRKNFDKRYLAALLGFIVPPAVGGLIQNQLYGVTLLWPGMTLSLLIIYLAIQNELLLLDDLTGCNNRQSFDHELNRRIANAKRSPPFALMLIDIDNFKSINDRYGRVEGDRVIKSLANILGTCFGGKGFISRYGGDEFAVIVSMERLDDLNAVKARVWDAVETWNAENKKRWRLSISLGSAPYPADGSLNQDNFFVQVDKLLSLDKIVPGDRRYRP